MSTAPHPYRTSCHRSEAPRRKRTRVDTVVVLVAQLFLLAWALLRIAICAVRGLDVEGVFAVIVVIGTGSTLGCRRRMEGK